MPPYPILITTDRPEDETWNYINKLTSLSYVKNLLDTRIRTDFFGFGSHIKYLNKSKERHNKKLGPDEKPTEIHEILTSNDIMSNANEMTVLARQAIELYIASRVVSIYARPILLYYSYAKLSSSEVSNT
jgi:hypothetical protein